MYIIPHIYMLSQRLTLVLNASFEGINVVSARRPACGLAFLIYATGVFAATALASSSSFAVSWSCRAFSFTGSVPAAASCAAKP